MNITEANATYTLLHALGCHPIIERWPTPDQITDAITTLALRADKALQVSTPAAGIERASNEVIGLMHALKYEATG